jgi:D-amino-acid oxidase
MVVDQCNNGIHGQAYATYHQAMPKRADVVVLGAGVAGLSTAIMLASSGFGVRIVARELPLATTSCAAGALWGPYLSPDDRVTRWSDETRRRLLELADRFDDSGVRVCLGLEAARTPVRAPAWARALPDFRPATPAELPPGFTTGWWYRGPLVEMPVYLAFLLGQVDQFDIPIEVAEVRSVAGLAPVVVNCTGLGARELAGDDSVRPVRGQLVVVRNPGLAHFFAEHDETPTPTYLLPHGDRLVLGGSMEEECRDTRPDPAVARDIIRRCARIAPAVADAEILGYRVGLRPTRPFVRLEKEESDSGYVIHNYGHGGAGVTVSWGCAVDVLAQVRALLGKATAPPEVYLSR